MLLRIQYTDNRYDMIQGKMLDRLITEQRITRFQRSTGWVRIGVDPIRTPSKTPYFGEERRAREKVVLS